ncbi:hypothetical protein PV326_006891 [Microctonus aethiopoides]|nr:hypothetical protein PV326_006891 [Microctonus aethiopoides]
MTLDITWGHSRLKYTQSMEEESRKFKDDRIVSVRSGELDQRTFERIVVYCDTFITLIPLSFVLGFYVAYVAARWWQQYIAIPWPDKVMHLVALYVTGNDEYGRMMRRSLMRYLNLSLILVLRSISSAVKRRFPTLDHVVDSGFMTALELELFQSVPNLEFNTYWIPCTWFINLLKEARRNHRLPDAQGLKIIMEEFNDFRSKCGMLWSYDWVSIPLVYTQVVTLATYSFFVVALVGRQYIEGEEKPFQMELDAYIPLFTVLQFFFYMGLLKVAEQLINPFGDDDEDFELNWLIDRHTKVSYLGVDTLMNRCPPLVKDIYFDSENLILPYTEAAASYKRKTYRGSVANMTVPEGKQSMFLPDITEEEDEESKIPPTPRTSTASLTTHPADSPIINRRQISGSPSTTPKMARNNSETIVQLDIQDAPIDSDNNQPINMTGTLKKSIIKTAPWLEINRKCFVPTSIKMSKVNLQPWPSATNLEETTLSYDKSDNSFSMQSPPPFITIRRESSDEKYNVRYCEKGFFNSAFSQENLPTDTEPSSSVNNITYECTEDNDERLRALPKFFVRRQSSTSSAKNVRKKKALAGRWRRALDAATAQVRRKTTDNLPSINKLIITQTSSTPNLKSLIIAGDKEIVVPTRAASEEQDERVNNRTSELSDV